MPNQTLKLLRRAAILAIGAVLAGQVLAADPVYLFKSYTPGVKGDYALGLSSTSLGFGSAVAGHSSEPQTVTLANGGASPISVTALSAAEGFTQTNNCGFIQPGASCDVAVTFSPPAPDAYAGNLAIVYDGARQATVALTGTGTPASAIASLSESNLSFGPIQVGANATQTVTLSNSGGSNLSVSSITADNAVFTVPVGCTTVVAGTPCVIDVKFTPTTSGAVSGTLTIVDTAAGSPRTVALSGTGNTPLASLSTPSLDLGSVIAGANNTLGVELSNTGNQDLAVSSVTVSGNAAFSATSDCTSVAPGTHCTANVTFAPLSATGAVTGTLSFGTNAPGGPQSVSLSGSGMPPPTYTTWNPSAKTTSPYVLALSSGNLIAAGPGGCWCTTMATQGESAGKWYWEVTQSGASNWVVGIGSNFSYNSNFAVGDTNNSWGYAVAYRAAWVHWLGATAVSVDVGPASGDTYMLALDMDNKALYFGKNGVWALNANPASGTSFTGAVITGLSGTVYPAVTVQGTSAIANFGATAFKYAVPAGYNRGVY